MQLLDLRHWTTVTKLIQELDLPAIEAPEVFFFTDHYRNYPYVLTNLIGVKRLSWK